MTKRKNASSPKSISQNRIKEVLNYNPNTGIFTWAKKMSNRNKGSLAGTKLNTGYIQIQIDGSFWLAHRLAWLYIYGNIPKEIDHINQVKSDNKICNLRPVEHWQQIHNSKYSKKSKYGYRGISPKLNSKINPWRAHTKIMGKYKYLGAFPTKERAAQAYNDAIIARYGALAGSLLNRI